MRRLFEYGGIAAGVVVIAFGIGSLVLSVHGKATLKDSRTRRRFGSPDVTSAGIAARRSRRA